jgi:hypothetical protein
VLTQNGGLRDETAAFDKELSPRPADRG